MPNTRYFLPKKFAHALTHESAKGLEADEAVIDQDGFKIPGFLFYAEDEAIEHFLKKAPVPAFFNFSLPGMEEKSGLVRGGDITVDGKSCALITVDTHVVHDIETFGCELSLLHGLGQDFTKTIQLLASCTGMHVLFAAPQSKHATPLRDDVYDLYIVIDASPPGDVSTLKRTKLCGLDLVDGTTYQKIRHGGPTAGYGNVVKDEDEHSVAQIVGNTLYLFVPLVPAARRLLPDTNGPGLFKRVLRLAWNAYLEIRVPCEETPITEEEEFVYEVQQELRLITNSAKLYLADIDQQQRNLDEQQAKLLADKRTAILMLEKLQQVQENPDHERWAKDWVALTSHPAVKRILSVDGGMHVETVALTGTHEGQVYQFGSFVIRYVRSEIFVWSSNPAHPRGRAHPHISQAGVACFGNMGLAIQDAASEMRLYDAVELVLRWLTEGYDPALAEVKIEDWPVLTKGKEGA